MADVLGSAYYELEARDTRARQTIDQLEAHIKRAGGSAEPGFAAPVTAATTRASQGFHGTAAAAKAAGDALPTQRVGGFAGALDAAHGKLGAATSAVGNFASGLKDRLGGALDGIRGSLGGFGSQLGGIASSALGAISGPLGLGVAGGVAASIIGIGAAALGASAQMETYRVQFETLLGSAKAAEERISELSEFAAATPFDLPGIVQASRTLEVFTKGAISTGDHLRLIGDAAASVNVPIEEVSFWTGRLYAAMAGGQPIGEMTMRLGEMGIIAPEVRTQIEGMAKGIKDGSLTINEAWPEVEQAFGRFAGGMERQSKTLAGRFSTFIDDVRMSLARFGDRLAPIVKDLLPGLGRAIADGVDALGVFIEVLGGAIGQLAEYAGQVEEGLNATQDFGTEVGNWIRQQLGLSGSLDTTDTALGRLRKTTEAAGEDWGAMQRRIEEVAVSLGHTGGATTEFAERVALEMERTGASFDIAVERVKTGLDGLPTAAQDSAVRLGQQYTAAMEAGAAAVEGGVEAGVRIPTEAELERTRAAAEASARAATADYSEEIAGGADIVEQAWAAMLSGAESEMTKTERIADIKAKLTSTKLRDALNSEDPYLAAQAEATRLTLEQELGYLESNTHEYARRTGLSLPDALKSQHHNAQAQAALLAQYSGSGLDSKRKDIQTIADGLSRASLPGDPGMYAAGQRVGVAWANGLRSAADYARLMAWEVAAATKPALHGTSPPKEGPLRDIDVGGANVVRAWADGLLRGRDAVRSAANDMAAAFAPDAALGGFTSGRSLEVRLRHEIVDPNGALVGVPGGAQAVAGMLNAGIDATPFVRNFAHLAGVN